MRESPTRVTTIGSLPSRAICNLSLTPAVIPNLPGFVPITFAGIGELPGGLFKTAGLYV